MTRNEDTETKICDTCKWQDKTQAQCYDGHLQYDGKQNCEGYEVTE